jgi:hypothetical protein
MTFHVFRGSFLMNRKDGNEGEQRKWSAGANLFSGNSA